VSAAGALIAVPAALGYGIYRAGAGQSPALRSPYAGAPSSGAPSPAGTDLLAPLLVLINGSDAAPFAGYLPELLRAEGIVGSREHQLNDNLRLDDLRPHPLVILSAGGLTSTQSELLLEYVSQGGALLALRPPAALAAAIGLELVASDVDEQYMTVDAVLAADWMAVPTTQLHGRADHYRPGPAQVSAWLGRSGADGASRPAVATGSLGEGILALTTFDPVESLVLMRQGNPAWVGEERDGRDGLRAQDLFVGWIDLDLIEAPQADLQLRFLSRLIHELLEDRLPLPRLWYFPQGARALLVATGDSHASPAATIDEVLTLAEGYGGRMSVYHTPPSEGALRRAAERAQSALTDAMGNALPEALLQSQPTPGEVAAWRARGHEFGLHPYVEEGLEAGWDEYWRAFTASGFAPVPPSTRTHAILWTGWTETARVQASHNIRMNMDFYHYGPAVQQPNGQWRNGYLTGSGLPMRFVDDQGQILGIYQQLTQLVDEHLMQMPWGMGGSNGTVEEAIEVSQQLLAQAVAKWPAAIGAQFHVDPFALGEELRVRSARWMEGTLAACRELGVPIVTAQRLLRYTEAREGAILSDCAWDAASGRFSCEVAFGALAGEAASPEAVGVLLPARFSGRPLEEVRWADTTLAMRTTEVAGRTYALVEIGAQRGRLVAQYGERSS
jgi:hypothetical protein